MAALMVCRLGHFATRKLLCRTLYSSRHVFISSVNKAPNIQMRLPSYCSLKHLSSSSKTTEQHDVEDFVLVPTLSEEMPTEETSIAETYQSHINLQELLDDMRYSFEKQHKLRPWCLELVLDKLSRLDVPVSDSTWTLLLRTSGKALVDMSLTERQAMCDKVIVLMKVKDVAFSNEHHNAILQSQLENHAIPWIGNLLSEMSEQNITLDATSYHLVIQKLCDERNITKALQVLDDIEKSGGVCEEVMYTPLITAYMSLGRLIEAGGIITRMENHGVTVTGESYKCLLLGYALRGYMDGIRGTLNFAKSKDISVHPQTILAVIKILDATEHRRYVPELTRELNEVLQKDEFVSEAVETIYQLRLECETAAFDLYKALEKNMPQRELILLLNRLFLNKDSGFSFALKVLEHLDESNRSLHFHQIDSLLHILSFSNHPQTVKLWASLLSLCNTEKVLEQVNARKIPQEENVGRNEKIFINHITGGNFERAVAFGNSYPVSLATIPSALTEAFVKGFEQGDRDIQPMVWALKHCSNIAKIPLVKVNSDVIFTILKDGKTKSEEVETFLKYAWQMDIKFLDEYVQEAVQSARLSESKPFVDYWASDCLVPIPTRAELLPMNLSQLEEQEEKFQMMGINSTGLTEILLNHYKQIQDTEEKVKPLQQTLDCDYYESAFGQITTCGRNAIKARRDSQEAQEYIALLEKFFPNNDTTEFSLPMADCQLENDQVEEAFKTIAAIKERPWKVDLSNTESYFCSQPINMPDIYHMLERFEDIGQALKMVELLLAKGVLDDWRSMNSIVRLHYKQGQFPLLDTMFNDTLLDDSTSDLLKAGLLEAQFTFYRELLDAGERNQIRQCFDNPNFRPIKKLQLEYCRHVIENFSESKQDELLRLLLDICDVDPDELILQLVKVVPRQQLQSSLLGKYRNMRDVCDMQETKPQEIRQNIQLKARNEELIKRLENSDKPLPVSNVKAHVVSLAGANMWLEFVDFVCALRSTQRFTEIKEILFVISKLPWITYTLQQLFQGYVESQNYPKVEALVKKVQSTPAWAKLSIVHNPSLLKLQEENGELASVIESHMLRLSRTNHNAGFNVLEYFLQSGRIDTAAKFLRSNPKVCEQLHPDFIVRSLEGCAVWTDEQKLTEILNLPVVQEQQKKRLRAWIYDQLIVVSCDAKNWQRASYFFNEAQDERITLAAMKGDTLRKLQALLQENDREIPWPTSLKQILTTKSTNRGREG